MLWLFVVVVVMVVVVRLVGCLLSCCGRLSEGSLEDLGRSCVLMPFMVFKDF